MVLVIINVFLLQNVPTLHNKFTSNRVSLLFHLDFRIHSSRPLTIFHFSSIESPVPLVFSSFITCILITYAFSNIIFICTIPRSVSEQLSIQIWRVCRKWLFKKLFSGENLEMRESPLPLPHHSFILRLGEHTQDRFNFRLFFLFFLFWFISPFSILSLSFTPFLAVTLFYFSKPL